MKFAVEDSDVVINLWPLTAVATNLAGVVEGGRYKYRVDGLPSRIVSIEPSELFDLDPDDSASGRFQPRECVGDLAVELQLEFGSPLRASFEVLPVKLTYETEYLAMLEQLADQAAEALLQGYSPSSLSAHPDPTATGELHYRALAFLAARFRQPTFLAAIEMIRQSPHRGWRIDTERQPTGRGLPTGSAAARTLAQSGPRTACPSHLTHLPTGGLLPRMTTRQQTVITYDTVPNRFVRHAFARWQGLALEVLQSLRLLSDTRTGPQRRGRKEAAWMVDFCDQALFRPPLRDAGPLLAFPHGNQVLLRTPGYREILRVYALAEASIALHAILPDDPFSATQKNVARLYEYWCFVALAGCISDIAGKRPEGLLFETNATGMSLVLKQGEPSRLSWEITIDERVLLLDLWFNKNFSKSADPSREGSSWARALRPDASLRIRPQSGRPWGTADPELDVWVHFDAKYRVENITVDADDDKPDENPTTGAKRDDLLKMHAYRDAIRRSAGAYVLYPGSGEPTFRTEFHELLPGLGAFPLRPGLNGIVEGSDSLKQFLQDVSHHVANQASAMERTQYWVTQYNRRSGRRVAPADFLKRPPADTPVLIGFADDDQVNWIIERRRYNILADPRQGAITIDDLMISSQIIVIWLNQVSNAAPTLFGIFERTGPWQVAAAQNMYRSGYPVRDPTARYFIAPINPVPAVVENLISPSALERLCGRPPTGPVSTTWEELVRPG